MGIETRELRIIFQNALAHATKIEMHNAEGGKVSLEDILDTAKKIAVEVVKLGIVKKEI